jgi:hypothetical protein
VGPAQAQVVHYFVLAREGLEDDRGDDLVLRTVLALLVSDVLVVDEVNRVGVE